jgi:hypothetical protein
MKKILLFSILFFPLGMTAQTPDWAVDVAPILYANCTKCHNSSGIAPFSLLTYNDALNNSISISDAVVNHRMPPWPPDSSYSRFAHERLLPQQDIQTIVDWVNGGSPSGNLAQAPPTPVYSSAAVLTNPDMALQMPAYIVNTASDLYRCFVIPTNLPNDEYITRVEVLPGNRSIVHHVLVYQDQANTCITLDNQDPGLGYTSFGGVGSNTATLVMGWVPGQGVYELPPNMGIKLLTNTNLILQVHYPAGTFNQVDSTAVRFTFSSGVVRDVTLAPVINHIGSLTNGPLFIPANQTATFHGQEFVSLNATIISVAPHMHLIGRSIYSYAVAPNNDTIPLISIPDWRFHWQGFYTYRQPVHVPFGSQLHASAFYDNTSNNAWNPNSPPLPVIAGEATADEMMIIYFAYLPYQAGDENIVIDSTILNTQQPISLNPAIKSPQLYDPFPVPATNELDVQYYLPEQTDVTIEIFDATGKQVRVPLAGANQQAGLQTLKIQSLSLAAGSYTIRLSASGVTRSKIIIVN